MTIEILRKIGNVGLFLSLAPFLAFVVLYSLRSNWRNSEYGVHLMSFMGSIALILGLGAIRVLGFGQEAPIWFETIRVVSFVVLIPGVGWWRLYLLVRDQNEARKRARKIREPE